MRERPRVGQGNAGRGSQRVSRCLSVERLIDSMCIVAVCSYPLIATPEKETGWDSEKVASSIDSNVLL
jgi:hypothetical protein